MRSEEASVRQQLGQLRHDLGLASEASDAGEPALGPEPTLADLWIQLGDLLLLHPNGATLAEDAFRRAITLSPGNPVGHLRLGSLLLGRGQTDRALRSLRQARDLAPAEGWVWSDIAIALADGGSLHEARSAIEQAIRREPDVPLHQFRLGEVLQRLGDHPDALLSFRRAAEAAPGTAWLQSHLGHVLSEAGSYDEAERALDRALQLDPDDDLTRSRRALLMERQEHASRVARRSLAAARSSRDFPIRACIVLAAPRTGSTVLGHSVGDAWHADFLGEVFHEDPQDDYFGANFFRFRSGQIASDPSLSVPTLLNQREILQRYCRHVQSITPSGASILDLKYYSWHHLNACFVLPHEPPTLVDFVRQASWPVVHLVRENLFALHCSLKLSEQRGVWHKSMEAEPDTEPATLVVDVDACRLDMERLQAARHLFDSWFQGYGNLHRLTYERLFEGDRFSGEVEETFTQIFDEPPASPLRPAMRKVTPPLGQVVENGDDVLRALAGTPFHAMAREALA